MAATAPEAIGRVFNVGNVIDHSLAEIAGAVIEATGSNGGLRSCRGRKTTNASTSVRSTPTAPASPRCWDGRQRPPSIAGFASDRHVLSWSSVVPVVDLSRRGQRFASSFAKAAEAIAASGRFLLGAELSAFESEFARWLGATDAWPSHRAPAHCSWHSAAAGIGPGDEVLVPAFTAVPTASAVAAVGGDSAADRRRSIDSVHHDRQRWPRRERRERRPQSWSTCTAIPQRSRD